jgi:hypothetical protein
LLKLRPVFITTIMEPETKESAINLSLGHHVEEEKMEKVEFYK